MTTTADAAKITENWKHNRFKAEQEYRIDIDGAPDVHAKHTAYHPYALWITFTNYGKGWTGKVLIYTNKRGYGGSTSMICTTMYASQLDELPAWLDDIITRAMPRES